MTAPGHRMRNFLNYEIIIVPFVILNNSFLKFSAKDNLTSQVNFTLSAELFFRIL